MKMPPLARRTSLVVLWHILKDVLRPWPPHCVVGSLHPVGWPASGEATVHFLEFPQLQLLLLVL